MWGMVVEPEEVRGLLSLLCLCRGTVLLWRSKRKWLGSVFRSKLTLSVSEAYNK